MKPAPTFTVTARNGIAFLVRLVRLGDPWGADFHLVHDGSDAMLEFYDTRYPHTRDHIGTREEAIAAGAPVLGQFVTRFNLSQLTQGGCRHGLILNMSIQDWQIDPDTMEKILAWVDTVPPLSRETFQPGQRVALRCHVRRTKESLGGYYYTLKPGTVVHVVRHDPHSHWVSVSDVAEADQRIGEDIFRMSEHMLTPAPEPEPSGIQTP